MGYSPRGRKESDTTERLHFTSLPSSFLRKGFAEGFWGDGFVFNN